MTIKKSGNVLIVDDQPELLTAYKRIIEKAGYTTFVASNGSEAMKKIGENDISLVLLDVILPDTNGFDVLKLLKSDPNTENIFVVLISSKVKSSEEQSEGLEIGADGYLVKPINSRELSARIDSFMKHKNTIDELRISEERFRKISDRNVDGILIIDYSGVIQFSNPAAEKLFFKERQLLKGVNFGYPIVQEDKTEISVRFENRFDHVSELRITDIIWENQKMLLVSIRDITERKLYEEKLEKAVEESEQLNKKYETVNRELQENLAKIQKFNHELLNAKKVIEESEQKYREIIASISDGFFVISGENFIITLFNNIAEKLLNRKAEDVLNKPLFEAFSEAKGSVFEENYKKAYSNHEFMHFETYFEPYNDWYDVRVYPGQQGLSVFFQVTTEQKKVEQELIIAKERAEESDRLKSAFLANMSHEIRTPLNAIMGFSDLLSKEDIPEQQKPEFAKIIKNSGEQLLKIIGDIIDISKIEAGQLDIKKEWFNLNTVVAENIKKYQQLPAVKEKNIAIKLVLPRHQNECFVNTDKYRFTQILDNLVSNAIKFTKNGIIEVGCNIAENENDGKLLFYVKDSGIGIKEEELDTIFERFRQAENNTMREGTGLGLTIIKGVIKLMDGDIWVKSKEKEGTTFFFTLPYESNDRSTLFIDETGKLNKTPDFSGFKVFYAEDDFASSLYLEEILKPTRIKIKGAANGKQLLDIINIDCPNIVLLDIRMPVMGGMETLKEIRKKHKNIPVIAQTAYALNTEKEEILNAGFNGYISKPINQTELFLLMDQLLKKYAN